MTGALLRALPIAVHDPTQNWPNVDLVALAWIALIPLAFWLPNISEIAWGEFAIRTRGLRQASITFQESAEILAGLIVRWSEAVLEYTHVMTRDDANRTERYATIYADYVWQRLAEASDAMVNEVPGERSISFWLHSSQPDELRFVAGRQLLPTKRSYSIGEGAIGVCFATNERVKQTGRNSSNSQRATLCEPVRVMSELIGVVCVERPGTGYFDSVSERIIEGLASQCAMATDIYQAAVNRDRDRG